MNYEVGEGLIDVEVRKVWVGEEVSIGTYYLAISKFSKKVRAVVVVSCIGPWLLPCTQQGLFHEGDGMTCYSRIICYRHHYIMVLTIL